ncbi:DNA-binding transcriptional LysR family regulator [Pseudomonas psychrotolerans]|nr:DNA-binding transcriptional LysR family regulator [Pseudomonas psychrotolerans]
MSRILNAQTQAWLQVFACAARHLSFTRCAEELHVTPGAISQQMRQLEERLGFKLFHRVARGLELTAEGQRLATTLNQAYGLIDAELRRLNAGQFGGVVRLRSIPSFLGKWLTPRLPLLQERFPDLQLRLVAEDSSWSLREGEFDLAIDLNDGSYPGLASTPLMEEEIFPVCAPSLLQGRPPLERAEDLEFYPLLHDITAWRGPATNMPSGSSTSPASAHPPWMSGAGTPSIAIT